MKNIDVDIEKIKYLYSKGYSERSIANLMNISRSTVYNRLYNKHYNLGNRKRFTIKENFFLTPNPINSYWAGFIAADGSVNKNTVSIEIHKKDLSHINKLRFLLDYNGTIHSRRNLVSIIINSYNLTQCLQENFNIIQNKSKVLLPPNIKNEEDIRSFIRGYIDGDGCYNSYYKLISIRGTEKLLNWIKDGLNTFANLNTKSSVIYDYGSYKLQVRGTNKYNKTIKWLFKNANNLTLLDRKYDIIKDIVDIEYINFTPPKIKNYNNIKSNIIVERNLGKKKIEIAEKYNISVDLVSNVLKQNNINHLDKRRLNEEEIELILKELECGTKRKEIALKFNINKSTIYEILKGNTRKSKKIKEKLDGKRSNEG